jgi:hypothetical protein
MKNIRCPFCNLITTIRYITNNDLYTCSNHNNIKVIFDPIEKDFWLYNNLYWIYVDTNANIMRINNENDNSQSYKYILFDPNLTPENFESKLKLYLIFQ